MKIFLIGLMGSGKSVLGKKISQSIKLPFIDLDAAIEQEEGVSVSRLFATKGKDYFRKIEAEHLRKQSEAKEFIMATGGGTPCFHDNMDFINAAGISVFLDTPIPEIVKRLTGPQKESRPLLESVDDSKVAETLERMLETRLSFYEQAHFIVNGATATAWDVIQLLHTKK